MFCAHVLSAKSACRFISQTPKNWEQCGAAYRSRKTCAQKHFSGNRNPLHSSEGHRSRILRCQTEKTCPAPKHFLGEGCLWKEDETEESPRRCSVDAYAFFFQSMRKSDAVLFCETGQRRREDQSASGKQTSQS